MILDAQNNFSDGQAISGTSATPSTNSIDLGAVRQMGVGEPLYVLVNVPVAAGGTTPTLTMKIQTDDNSSFSSATDLLTTQAYAAAALVAGAQFVLPLPVSGMERYIRMSYTMGGTSPTITVDAHVVTAAQLASLYPSGYSIQ